MNTTANLTAADRKAEADALSARWYGFVNDRLAGDFVAAAKDEEAEAARLELVAHHRLYNATGTERIVSKYAVSPDAPFEVIGTVTLHRPHTFLNASQYPGADLYIECQPQTVEARSNGYYVCYGFEGIAVAGGHYFKASDAGKPAMATFQPYAYSVDEAIHTGPAADALITYHLNEKI